MGRHLDMQYFKYLSSLDNQISRNFRDANIQTRPVNSNGLWCCLLFPAVLIGYTLLYKVTPTYHLVTFISVGLLVYSFLFILFVSVSCLVLEKTVFGGCVASGFVSALLIYWFLGESLPVTLGLSMGSVHCYSYLLITSLTKFPRTFTIGEAMVFQQGVVLFGTAIVTKTINFDDDDNDEDKLVNIFLFTVFSTVGLIVTALVLTRCRCRCLRQLCAIVLLAGIYAILALHALLGRTAILLMIQYVFRDALRITLLCTWLAMSLLSVAALVWRTRQAAKASSATRKVFHLLATVVFVSGILYDVALITMAAGFALALIVFLEALRKSEIEPVSSALQGAFDVYSDEKDCGAFAITPLYLLVGLALPLAVCPAEAGRLELLAGALATGIGDSAAAWAGRLYGYHYWADSNKTIEGTVFNILSQIATVYALEFFELLQCKHALLRTAIAATAAGVVEARTRQVDNLVLPLVMLAAFQTTRSLA